MTVFSPQQFPTLFRTRWTTTGLADAIRGIDVPALCREYEELRKRAPSRSAKNKRYFVGHDGYLQAQDPGNPSEDHLAIALWRLDARRPRAAGGRVRLLDYQFPLQASRSDAGLGKVDLLGATDEGRLVVIELKVPRKNGTRGDTPVRALMEGLRYAAVVDANHRAIAAEACDCFGIRVRDEPPIIQILAPEDWWSDWCEMIPRTRRVAGPWESRFVDLSAQLEARLGVAVQCASLEATGLPDVDWDAHGPRLGRRPRVPRVHLVQALTGAPELA